MAHRLEDETSRQLLELARAEGFGVSPTQLTHWHQTGLLPPPKQRSLGRGKGTETVYPLGTGDQLLALCGIHAHKRLLDEIGWRLWWQGYPVRADVIQRYLADAAEKWDATIASLRGPFARGLSQLALSLVEKAASSRLGPHGLGQVRKRTGPGKFPQLIRAVLEVATGTFEGFEDPEDEQLLVKGLGLERAQTDRIGEAGPWLPGGGLEPSLKDLSQLLVAHPLCDVLAESGEDELLAGRTEARSFVNTISGVSLVFDRIYASGAFGFSALRRMFESAGPFQQALFVLVVVLFRRHGSEDIRQGMDTYRQLESEAQRLVLFADMIEDARREIPALAPVFAPDQIRRALRYPYRADYLRKQIQRVREEHLDEVNAFFERHPEHRSVTESHTEGGEAVN